MTLAMLPIDGPKAYNATYKSMTLDGALGRVHQSIDKSADKLIHHAKDEFHLTGAGYETRKRKFLNTMKTFYNAGGAAGAVGGTALMVPADLLLGRGNVPEAGKKATFLDDGALGKGSMFVGMLTSGGAEFIGKGVGCTAAAVSIAAKDTEDSPKRWIKDGTSTGGKFAGKTVGHVMGTGLGLATDIVRLPSIIVKGTLKGVCAVLGGTIGFFAGSVRAIINR